jgi:hypothetical protein
MEKKYVFFKMTSAPIVDSDDDTDKNSVECQRFVITCRGKHIKPRFIALKHSINLRKNCLTKSDQELLKYLAEFSKPQNNNGLLFKERRKTGSRIKPEATNLVAMFLCIPSSASFLSIVRQGLSYFSISLIMGGSQIGSRSLRVI